VSDWRDGDDIGDDDESPWAERPRSPRESGSGEGVRILGAEPAGRAAPRFLIGDDDDGESWSAASRDDDPSGPAMPLPHWTEPPTGEVPRIRSDDDTSDDLESWSSVTAATPRFRTGSGDWAAGDFDEGDLAHDDSTAVGALSEAEELDDEFPMPMTRKARREALEREREAARAGGRTRRSRSRGTGAEDDGPFDDFDEPLAPPPPVMAPGPRGDLEGDYHEAPIDVPRRHARAGDAGQRVFTALIVGGIALVAFFAGRLPTMLLATVIVGLAAFELFEGIRRAGYHTATAIGLLGCIAIVPIAYDRGERAFPLVTVLVVVFTMLWYLIGVVRARPTVNVALTLLVFGYVGILGAFAGLLLADNDGVGYIAGVAICAVGADVFGWLVGSRIGKTALMPHVSPNKTLEGLIAGSIAAIVLGAIVGGTLHPWADGGVGDGILLGIVVAVLAPIGDLCESMFKRDLGVKDLGNVLPGHGGILDRFDAILFCLPGAYYLALHLL
jgi:phosphatidate cytidylyltransferase